MTNRAQTITEAVVAALSAFSAKRTEWVEIDRSAISSTQVHVQATGYTADQFSRAPHWSEAHEITVWVFRPIASGESRTEAIDAGQDLVEQVIDTLHTDAEQLDDADLLEVQRPALFEEATLNELRIFEAAVLLGYTITPEY